MTHRETKAQLIARILNPTDVRNRLASTPALELAALAGAYQRAKAEGRDDDARAIKAEALALKAQTLGISYEVFEAERAAYEAEREATSTKPARTFYRELTWRRGGSLIASDGREWHYNSQTEHELEEQVAWLKSAGYVETAPRGPGVLRTPHCFQAYDADSQCIGEYTTFEAARDRVCAA